MSMLGRFIGLLPSTLLPTLVLVPVMAAVPAFAAVDHELRAAYDRLDLTATQRRQINNIEKEWNAQYSRMQPELKRLQARLLQLLSNPSADPLEITHTQQRIASIKQQLASNATATVLKKRRVLTEPQREQLRSVMQRMLAERDRQRL